jgi:hypothetical protein
MKPECEIDEFGTKRWYLNGKLHREDGPAVEYTHGDKFWYFNGELHREDGPALEFTSGYKCWYINDEKYTEQEYYKKLYNLGIITYDD